MRIIAFVLLLAAVLPASAQVATNLLVDPSFEEATFNPFSDAWRPWGNTVCETITPRTKLFVAKIYGNFKGEPNWSGIYQDVDAKAGARYEATGWFRQNSKDHLQGDNKAWLKLEFYDAAFGQPLAVAESLTKMDAKSPSNKYLFLSTGQVTAPPGTVKARVVAIFEQDAAGSPGAALADDLSLKQLP